MSAGGDAGRPVGAAPTPDSSGRRRRSTRSPARIVDELLPPIEMSGCTARILELAAANLAAADAATARDDACVAAEQGQATFQADFADVPMTLPSALSFSRCAWTCHPAASTSSGGRSVSP